MPVDLTKTDFLDRRSLVESFVIEELYGYRTISLTSDYAATILIARNGAGKTTLVGAMNAFLTGEFGRLRDLQFSRIRCKLSNFANEIVLEVDDVRAFCAQAESDFVSRFAKLMKISGLDLLNFVFSSYRRDNFSYDHRVMNAAISSSEYSVERAKKILNQVYEQVRSNVPNIERISDILNVCLKNTDIVYLPTYRRIELPLTDTDSQSRKNKPFDIYETGLYPGDIQFGLSDISAHLKQLNETILFQSNQGYRTASANIISELMDGELERWQPANARIPRKEDLELFLSRLKEGRTSAYYGPYEDYSIPDLTRFNLMDSANTESTKFLSYFLTKLSSVINLTREPERRVEEFVNVCNKYLSADDLSAEPPNKESRLPPITDRKELRLNKRNLSVNVFSIPSDRPISIEALSSGEKQMISLFAKLYLYKNKKLILIDEPELSLSIEWQQNILLDILAAPNCTQVVAITHSPFIFDNQLERFAKSLKVELKTPPLNTEELFSFGEDDL